MSQAPQRCPPRQHQSHPHHHRVQSPWRALNTLWREKENRVKRKANDPHEFLYEDIEFADYRKLDVHQNIFICCDIESLHVDYFIYKS